MIRAALLLGLALPSAWAAPCEAENFETRISGASECLLMRRYGPTDPGAMVVFLHGDLSSGGPADYHFAIAEAAAETFRIKKLMAVALVRPGYPDGTGESSSASVLQGGRSDHYTRENLTEVGTAVERLRDRFRPKSLILVGHSGGAATAAVLLGLKPRLAEAAVLVACPCELDQWRSGRRPWSRSENPAQWADKVDASARVVAITGSRDNNTSPHLAAQYIDRLKARGIAAEFRVVPDATHNSVVRSSQVSGAILQMLAD